MWCFFDESYPSDRDVTAIVACLMQSRTVRVLDKLLYEARREFFGQDHARDLTQELKGKDLLSNYAIKMQTKHGQSRNLEFVDRVLNGCNGLRHTENRIYLFSAVIYGAREMLTKVQNPKLDKPIARMLDHVSAAACRINPKDRVNLVFDEQLGTRAAVSIRTRRFVAGVALRNVSHFPLSGVSNVIPGIQLADIGAAIVGKRAAGDKRFDVWVNKLNVLTWRGHVDGKLRKSLMFFEKIDGVIRHRSGFREMT